MNPHLRLKIQLWVIGIAIIGGAVVALGMQAWELVKGWMG